MSLDALSGKRNGDSPSFLSPVLLDAFGARDLLFSPPRDNFL